MPNLALPLSPDLLARLRALADADGAPLEIWCAAALDDYLRQRSSRARGGLTAARNLTPDERRARATRASRARWGNAPTTDDTTIP